METSQVHHILLADFVDSRTVDFVIRGRNKCFRCGHPSHIQWNYPSGDVAIGANKVSIAASSAPVPKSSTSSFDTCQNHLYALATRRILRHLLMLLLVC